MAQDPAADTETITTASHFLKVICAPLERAGFDVAKIFADLDIPIEVLDDPRGLVPADQYLKLVRKNWELLDDEFMGLSGSHCKQGHYALMVRYIHHQDTLRAVLKEIQRFYTTVREDIEVQVVVEEDEVEMRFALTDDRHDTHHFLVEFMLVVFHRTLCWLTDTKMVVNQVFWKHALPEHVSFYRDLFDTEHHFDAGRNAFRFSKKYLSLPVAVSYEQLKEFLKYAPADLLVTPGTDNTFTTRIKGMVLTQQRAGLGLPDFISVARELCVSPQTLRRKLQAENTSYQSIKDSLRRDIAIDKLVNEHLSVAEIGQVLGFVEPASFTRAFKQWTGVSPAEYREQKLRKSMP